MYGLCYYPVAVTVSNFVTYHNYVLHTETYVGPCWICWANVMMWFPYPFAECTLIKFHFEKCSLSQFHSQLYTTHIKILIDRQTP